MKLTKKILTEMVRQELTEAIGRGMKWEDLKSGTSIEFTGGTTYVVTKIDKNKLDMSLKRRGKMGGGLFAGRAKLDKSQFESQVRVGFIKYLVNTNPRVKEGKDTYKQIGTNKNDGYILHGKDVPLKEGKETIFDVAAQVMKDKSMHVYQSSRGKVKVDMQTANLLMKVFKKVNPNMKKILTDLGYKNPAQLVQTLWAVVK